ncbi:hypothetical protein F4782DRAFT_510084 [Xylaria castorea]|nr:hypothetical protein F4782DRAFT_510084 [Xylaria castorea]
MSHSPRFSELRQFVFGDNDLTLEEARYLKFLLYGFHTDLIGELPLELVILVALELQLDDFAHCLCVSKAWRRRFLSDSVMLAYASHRWPAMIDGVVNRSKFLETLMKLRRVSHVFRQFESRDDIEKVRWDSKAHYILDPVFHTQPSDLPEVYTRYSVDQLSQEDDRKAFYASGKVAWHLPGCAIAIDDLRSKTRKIFTPPSGTIRGSALKLRSLGSRLAIGIIDRLLIVWDHVDNQAYEKSLPSQILRCVTQNSRVATVLYGGDVVTWTPNHAAIHLDTSRLILGLGINPSQAITWKACLNVFFDPHNSKNLYLASGYLFWTGSKSMVRVTVHEFSESVHVASWSSDYRDPVDHRFRPDERRPEPCIMSFDYEFDHSCIVFNWRTRLERESSLIGFDKIKRKFVDIHDCYKNYLCILEFTTHGYYIWGSLQHIPPLLAGIDLDFQVYFDLEHYSVRQLTLPQNTHDNESCQHRINETETVKISIAQ